jgi:MOSC domain-containing protein YiiM
MVVGNDGDCGMASNEDFAGARVASVHSSGEHTFSKHPAEFVRLVAGIGVEGDAHSGAQVKHRSRVAKDPTQPNLRQVLLFTTELLDHVARRGFDVAPGQLGENITTTGIDVFDLPVGTVLRLGDDAMIALTGLRNPCGQINGLREGLLSELRVKVGGETVRRGGVMSVVVRGGEVRPGDPIRVAVPPGEPVALEPV